MMIDPQVGAIILGGTGVTVMAVMALRETTRSPAAVDPVQPRPVDHTGLVRIVGPTNVVPANQVADWEQRGWIK